MLSEENQVIAIVLSGTFFAALMSVFVVAMLLLHRQRQNLNKQKLNQVQAEHEKMLLDIENEIQQETLAQIGRELHDNIGQLLSLAKLNLNSSKPEKQVEGKEYVNQIIKEVRALSKTLNLDWVESVSLDDFISQQLEKIQSTGYCNTSLQSDQSFRELTKDQKLVLIRVIQECLNNAIKHAQPDRIDIRITKSSQSRSIEIRDDGVGFDTTQKSNGSGMYNLSKRMETIGGKFYLTSNLGKGTQIILELPF